MSCLSQIHKSTEKPVALFSSKRKSSQEAFSDREEFSTEHQQVLGNNKPLFRFSNLENTFKYIPWRTQILYACTSKIWSAEAWKPSRLSRQFCSWSSETTWFQSFGNLLYQSRLWRISKKAGQTSWRISSARKSTSRNLDQKYHEVGGLKRAYEIRIDEISRNELRESHAEIQELTSKILELQERMFFMIQVIFKK